MKNISDILKQFISERIPQKTTNIFFQMFNGIQAMFEHLEYRMNIFKRERNMLTAQNLSSLRSLAAENGFEPKLRTPAKGILLMKISPKLFNRLGYPMFIKPYSVFSNKLTKLEYYYVSDKTIRIDSNTYYIPVVEGQIMTMTVTGTDDYIQRFYINEENVAEESIVVEVSGKQFQEVKSFYDNEGVNENRQFMVKFSNNAQTPIILYIKGVSKNDTINITYRLTSGELGNLYTQQEFDTESFVDIYGSPVNPADDEVKIVNITGFGMGSNGTDENSLRAAIGYNHGINLLFDNISYRNFLGKFSTILVQDIKINKDTKQINNIFIWRKCSLNPTNNSKDIINQYKKLIDNEQYNLPENEKIELNNILSEYEYCLSSHNLYNPQICKWALQVTFETKDDLDNYRQELEQLIYFEFSKFLYIRANYLNFETIFDDFRKNKNVNFEYIAFNQMIEQKKIREKKNYDTPYIIYHTVNNSSDYTLRSEENNKNYISNIEGPYLPLLKGDFRICDSEFKSYQLFSDINWTVKN